MKKKKSRYCVYESSRKHTVVWTTEIHDMMKPADFNKYVRLLFESGDIRNVLADNTPKENIK